MNNSYNKPQKQSTSSERLATCSLLSGIIGLICSFFYLPMSLISGSSYPTGLICGVLGIVLAIMAKNADIRPRKAFPGKAVVGLILSITSIGLTFLFFLNLVTFYDMLRDPVAGPRLNRLIQYCQEYYQKYGQLPSLQFLLQ